ncbi:3729_t:CDS:2 [Ambispora gerdemannii]|uniref:3729_t:CDS:1 n=1 Tax=Ambispora gerdemannii TaxID=144530 RepID=A0A9N8VZY6_9GLOM|nr:3729_t:CDS:2 [Ambispora gerdemannii]
MRSLANTETLLDDIQSKSRYNGWTIQSRSSSVNYQKGVEDLDGFNGFRQV